MKQKVEHISSELAARLSGLRGVDAITLAETSAVDLSDPYFFVSLDVYYRGSLTEAEVRHKLFQDAGAFESSTVASKDRFLIEGLPVRIEYKDMARIDEILGKVEQNLWVFRQTGTYMFNRLQTAVVLKQKSNWIETVRKTLDNLPASFWMLLAKSSEATMEHYLGDYAAGVIRGDALFSLVSAAGFIKSCCSTLFVLNHRFEPSSRVLSDRVVELPLLPEHFRARFETFLSDDPDSTPGRKREIAELIATSVVRLL